MTPTGALRRLQGIDTAKTPEPLISATGNNEAIPVTDRQSATDGHDETNSSKLEEVMRTLQTLAARMDTSQQRPEGIEGFEKMLEQVTFMDKRCADRQKELRTLVDSVGYS